MGPSPTLVAPGLRTAARVGWRGGVATAGAVVLERPSLWLLGALGYLLRGGALGLTLAIVVLPSPVSVRLMLGGYLGSSGLTPEFYLALAGLLGLLGALVLLVLALIAYVELAAFERFVASEAALLSAGRSARPPDPSARRRLLGALFVVQLAALAALLIAAAPLVATAVQATYGELVRPNLAGGAFYDRVLAQLGGPIFLLLVVLVLVEMVSAVASRRLLATAFGLGAPADGDRPRRRHRLVPWPLRALGGGLVRPLLRPRSTLPTALLGWLAMLAVVLPLGWVLPMAWDAVRAAFLAGARAEAIPDLLVASVLLSGVWLAGLGLAGLVSALRAGLWSSEELR